MDIEQLQRVVLSYRDQFEGPHVSEVRVTTAFAEKLKAMATHYATPVVPLNQIYGTPVVVDDDTVPSDPGYRVVHDPLWVG